MDAIQESVCVEILHFELFVLVGVYGERCFTVNPALSSGLGTPGLPKRSLI